MRNIFPKAFDNAEPGIRTSIDADEILKRAPDSASMLEYWDLTDILVEGADAIRDAGDKYLPKFPDESKDQYDFRLRGATKFTNVYRDIVESLASKPFEEEVAIVSGEGNEPPEVITDLIEDIDGSGNNLTVFASLTFFNGINSAIDWIFVDYPQADPSRVRTAADAKRENIRPFWSHVLGRNILEARTQVIGGKEVLTYMRILEPGKPDHVRIFEREASGIVTWALYVKDDKAPGATVNERNAFDRGKVKFILEGNGVVTIGVIPLVPFATGRRNGRTFKYFPSMRDAADLQRELYQQESGLKFAKIMTAFPMLAANGLRPEKNADGTPKKVAIGPAKILWGTPNSEGQAGTWTFIEPSASSLTFLANDIKETIQQLRELGRQPLTANSANLTVITTAVAAGKAKSAVGAWALLLKDALENALVLTCKWLGINDDVYSPEVSVYNDFDNFTEGSSDLEHLRSMRQTGDLSQETLWIETKRRRVLSAEFDKDEELKRLLDEMPGEEETDDEPPPLDPNAPPPPINPEPIEEPQ